MTVEHGSRINGQGQNAGGDGSLAGISLDSTLQSYGFAVEHSLMRQASAKAAVHSMDLDAEEAYDHDNFSVDMFFVRLRIGMP